MKKTQEIAKKIVKRLIDEGYIAYYAGGWVRDYVMGHPSEDIDIATDAPPEEIVKLFKKTVQVGISFGVVGVVMDGHQFEVATFRKDLGYADGRRPTEIVQTSPEEDALRRDFTINGMFYDPLKDEVIDFVGGQQDIKNKVVRTIGNAEERFREDRLRMIRAVRFAYRFGFHIDEKTKKAISKHAEALFPSVAIERVWQELKKMAAYPGFDKAVVEMFNLGLLHVIFPQLSESSKDELVDRAESCQRLPKGSSPILYILQLFPEASHDELIKLCEYLKVSNADLKLVEYFDEFRGAVQKSPAPEDAVFANLYAHQSSGEVLEVLAARLTKEKAESFLYEHRERKCRLKVHINRIQKQSPLITAKDLMEKNIKPGKKMGELLKEAERIAINRDINDKNTVITLLGLREENP